MLFLVKGNVRRDLLEAFVSGKQVLFRTGRKLLGIELE
jgi:hypothetical protein